ncbi:MAG: hypothetical protein ACOH19_14785 [Rhodoglobus sp.]
MSDPRETSVDDMSYPAPDFDVRDFARTAAGSHRDRLDLDRYADTPLNATVLRLLRYLQIVERGTMTHLRSVLVTATHKDARITAFLTTWAYEKYWIADAIDQIILAHAPEGTEPDRAPFNTPVERTIRESIFANIVGVPMIAVHMSVSTVDEWLMQAAYSELSDLAGNLALTEEIDFIISLKERQLVFFEAQARYRLLDSAQARRHTRRRLQKTAWPVGAKAEKQSETAFFYEQLFSKSPDLIATLDARVDTLPGQNGLGLIRRATTQ